MAGPCSPFSLPRSLLWPATCGNAAFCARRVILGLWRRSFVRFRTWGHRLCSHLELDPKPYIYIYIYTYYIFICNIYLCISFYIYIYIHTKVPKAKNMDGFLGPKSILGPLGYKHAKLALGAFSRLRTRTVHSLLYQHSCAISRRLAIQKHVELWHSSPLQEPWFSVCCF